MSTLLTPLALAINAALAQDPESQAKLAQFNQRTIAIVIDDLERTLNITISDQQLQLTMQANDTADLTITGNALALAKLTRDPDHLFSPDIAINGDVQFAKQLRDLLTGFEFDWEAQLARLTGDSLAYPIAHGLRQFAGWAKESHQSLQMTMAEYLREESQILPDQSQIKRYLRDIDQLRADVDRLSARIDRLGS